jgi:hypothetical protein
MEKEIIEYFKKRICAFPQYYPIIASRWNMELLQKEKSAFVSYSGFKTISYLAPPFYKPISKMIDMQNLKSDE